MSRTPTYKTYEELSEGTGIQQSWLRVNLRRFLPTTAIRIIPGSPHGEVHLKVFKEWLKRARIVKYTQMCMHLGMSKGQANGDIRKIKERVLIPSTKGFCLIQERDAVDLAQGHRESVRGLKGDVGCVRKPSTVKYEEKPKRVRAKPLGTRPTLRPEPPVKPKSEEALRKAGADTHIVQKGFEGRKPTEMTIRIETPVPITITVKYGE